MKKPFARNENYHRFATCDGSLRLAEVGCHVYEKKQADIRMNGGLRVVQASFLSIRIVEAARTAVQYPRRTGNRDVHF